MGDKDLYSKESRSSQGQIREVSSSITEESDPFSANQYFGSATLSNRTSSVVDTDNEDSSMLSSSSKALKKDKYSSSTTTRKSKNPISTNDITTNESYSGLSPETQNIINSINSLKYTEKKKTNVSRAMVDEILRDAKLKVAARAIENNLSSGSTKKLDTSRLASSKSMSSVGNTLENKYNFNPLSTSDQDEKKSKDSFTNDEVAENPKVQSTNRTYSRLLPSRLASLIGINTGSSTTVDSSKTESKLESTTSTKTDGLSTMQTGNSTNHVADVDTSRNVSQIKEDNKFNQITNESNVSKPTSSNNSEHSKQTPDISVDTNVGRTSRKEQKYVVRSTASPRFTKKRGVVIRRSSAKIIPKHGSEDDYQRTSKKPVKTVEISSELDELGSQFQETLTEFSKRYQDSTVALAEKSYLLKRNQELWHTLAAKEEEIEYLKNELWQAGNKIQDYESDLKDIIEQQQEPLTLTQEDLIRIEREIDDQEVLINDYQRENDKLVGEIKNLNERLRVTEEERENYYNKINELYKEIEILKESLHEQETKEIVPDGTMRQIEDMKKEIERLKGKEISYEFKEMALKEMDGLKKELSALRDIESEYMLKVDDLEHQLAGANEEIEEITRSKTESLEKLTEEMNMMKYTYESQIENIKKESISKEGKETRFRKLQNALEKIETIASTYPEVTQVCTDLRRINLLPPKKRRKSATDLSNKDIYGYGTKETRSTRSPTTKSLKRSPSQSSLGRKSRASSLSRTVSPTPSVLSSVSAFSSKDLQDEETLYSSEEITELKEKVVKLEEENKTSNESIEKLEEELKLLNESKSKLEEEVNNLKQEQEHCDRKMKEMEELLAVLPSDEPDDNDSNANKPILLPNSQPVIPPQNLIQQLDNKQNIIEELEYEQLVERAQAAAAIAQITPNGTTSEGGESSAVNGNSDPSKVPIDISSNIESNDFSLASDIDIMDFFGLGDNQVSAIEKLIAQLERTIVERTMQRDAAHQRATDAETKLLALAKEKMKWGSGYDSTVKQLKTQVQHLQELLQMERKAARKSLTNDSTQDKTDKTDKTDIQSDSQELPSQTGQHQPKPTCNDQPPMANDLTSELKDLRNQIELLAAENKNLKAQLNTSEAIRQAVHENTLTILQQANKSSHTTDENVTGIRKLALEKEAEVSVLKSRCVGLENVIERQRELLSLIVPTIAGNVTTIGTKNLTDGNVGDIKKLVEDDGIDENTLTGLTESAKRLIQQLREENALLRKVLPICQQQISKNEDEPPQYTPPLVPFSSSTPTSIQLDALASQISEMEARFLKREKELQDIIAETKRQGELQLERWNTHKKVKNKPGVPITSCEYDGVEVEAIRHILEDLEAQRCCTSKFFAILLQTTKQAKKRPTPENSER
ncbi:13252_t:CDS:2, partial [Dentiscutata erythropus]